MKALGVVMILAGLVLGGISYLWGRSGYYLSDGPKLIALAVGGVILLALGSVITQRASRGAPIPQAAKFHSQSLSASVQAPSKSFVDDASDPATPLARLAELAYSESGLRPLIAANPSAYPDLLAWLASLGDPDVNAALERRAVTASLEASASDPATDPARLAELAYTHPILRSRIAANPSAYPALVDWIAAAGDVARSAVPSQLVGETAMRVAPIAAKPRIFWTRENTIAVVAIALTSLLGIWAITGTVTTILAGVTNAIVYSVSGLPSGDSGGTVGGGSDSGQAGSSGTGTTGTGTTGTGTTGNGSGGNGTTGSGGSGSGNGSGGASGTAQRAGESAAYVPTVLILDASGSMVRDVPGGGTRMEAARNAAITFVNGLGKDARVGLTVFGTSTGNADSDQAAGCSDVKRVIPVGPVDKTQFTGAIASIVESGFTPLGPAMRNAEDQLGDAEQALIVIVSDGVDTCSPPPACDVAAEVHAQHPGFSISAIGFNVDADEEAQAQLECIAREGGGEYVDAANAVQLAAHLRALSDPVSTAGALNARGIETLRLGMSVKQAMAADSTIVLGKTVVNIQYADCDSGKLQFKDGRLYSIQPDKSARTVEGVSVGDPLSAATDVYGQGTADKDADGTFITVQATRGSDSGYRIYYKDGKVITLVVCLCGGGSGLVSELTNWQLGFSGLGPLKVGWRPDDVYGVISASKRDPSTLANSCGVFPLATSGVAGQVAVLSSAVHPDSGIYAYVVSHSDAIPDDLLPKTTKGIGVGSSLQELLAAYPGLSIVNSDQGRYGIVTNRTGVSLLFGLDAGIVNYLQVGNKTVHVQEACEF